MCEESEWLCPIVAEDGAQSRTREITRVLKVPHSRKWFKQVKAAGTIKTEKATMLFDSGAEVLILETNFARKVRYVVDKI